MPRSVSNYKKKNCVSFKIAAPKRRSTVRIFYTTRGILSSESTFFYVIISISQDFVKISETPERHCFYTYGRYLVKWFYDRTPPHLFLAFSSHYLISLVLSYPQVTQVKKKKKNIRVSLPLLMLISLSPPPTLSLSNSAQVGFIIILDMSNFG